MKKTKWLSLIVALMVCLVSAVAFSGCETGVFDETSTIAEYSNAYVTASKNFEKMLSYDKIEASTVVTTASLVVENKHSLTYKETVESDATITKEFFDQMTKEMTSTVYVVRNNGEVFAIVEQQTITVGTEHSVTDEQLLKTEEYSITETKTYELGVVIGSQENQYFMLKESKVEKKDAPTENKKEYKLYQDKQAYVEGVTDFAESLFGGFMSVFESVYSKDGDINISQAVSLKNALDRKVTLRGSEYSLNLSTIDGSDGMLIADSTYRLTDTMLKNFIIHNTLIKDGLEATFEADASFVKGAEKYKTYTDPTNGYEENLSLSETEMGIIL